MDPRKKELKSSYKLSTRPMGVFQIRNLKTDRVFIGSSINLDGILNRHRFQLEAGSHSNKALQTDWTELGADAFAFEVLEEVLPRDNPSYDYKSDLEVLEKLWLERYDTGGDLLYNERKLTRAERLQMIAANRNKRLGNDI